MILFTIQVPFVPNLVCRRKTPVKNKQQVDTRVTLKRARVEYNDDNACTSNLSKLLRDCESIPSVSSVSQFHSLDESVISFVDVLRNIKPVTVVEDVITLLNLTDCLALLH